MAPGQQAGFITQAPNTGTALAAVWAGTPESSRLLHPWAPTVGSSTIYATTGMVQAGRAYDHGFPRAAVWFNTPESHVDLHALLPSQYMLSEAYAVTQHEGVTIVGGYAMLQGGGRQHAVIWVHVPAPATLAPLAALGLVAVRRQRKNHDAARKPAPAHA
jgi:hypothetical protein